MMESNMMKKVLEWYPVANYTHVVKDMDINSITELDYIQVMYTPPLNASRKIQVRNRLTELMKKSKNKSEADFIVHLLAWYGCI